MRRVVLDTNIYISAFMFDGIAEQLVRLAEDGLISVYLSPPIVREIRRIMQTKFGWTTDQMKLSMIKLERIGHVVTPRFRLHVLADRADNRILECAWQAKVEYIITGDKGLLALEQYKNIQIVSPRDFLAQYSLKKAA